MDLLIALIPALPLAGFLFAVLAGSRLDHVPVHGHGHDADEHAGTTHDGHDDATTSTTRPSGPSRPRRSSAQPARTPATPTTSPTPPVPMG